MQGLTKFLRAFFHAHFNSCRANFWWRQNSIPHQLIFKLMSLKIKRYEFSGILIRGNNIIRYMCHSVMSSTIVYNNILNSFLFVVFWHFKKSPAIFSKRLKWNLFTIPFSIAYTTMSSLICLRRRAKIILLWQVIRSILCASGYDVILNVARVTQIVVKRISFETFLFL